MGRKANQKSGYVPRGPGKKARKQGLPDQIFSNGDDKTKPVSGPSSSKEAKPAPQLNLTVGDKKPLSKKQLKKLRQASGVSEVAKKVHIPQDNAGRTPPRKAAQQARNYWLNEIVDQPPAATSPSRKRNRKKKAINYPPVHVISKPHEGPPLKSILKKKNSSNTDNVSKMPPSEPKCQPQSTDKKSVQFNDSNNKVKVMSLAETNEDRSPAPGLLASLMEHFCLEEDSDDEEFVENGDGDFVPLSSLPKKQRKKALKKQQKQAKKLQKSGSEDEIVPNDQDLTLEQAFELLGDDDSDEVDDEDFICNIIEADDLNDDDADENSSTEGPQIEEITEEEAATIIASTEAAKSGHPVVEDPSQNIKEKKSNGVGAKKEKVDTSLKKPIDSPSSPMKHNDHHHKKHPPFDAILVEKIHPHAGFHPHEEEDSKTDGDTAMESAKDMKSSDEVHDGDDDDMDDEMPDEFDLDEESDKDSDADSKGNEEEIKVPTVLEPERLTAEEEETLKPAEKMEVVDNRISETIKLLSNLRDYCSKTVEQNSTPKPRNYFIDMLVEDLCTYFSYNEFLIRKFLELFHVQEILQVLNAFNEERPLTIRVNTLKTTRNTLADALIKRGVDLKSPAGGWSKCCLVIDSSKVPIGATPEILCGHYMIQGASSLLPVMALTPKESDSILDMCSAPGGKSSHIAALMKNKGILVANDSNKTRCQAIVGNLSRMGVKCATVVSMDGRKIPSMNQKYDKILLDAPCSGTGIISKDASVKYSKDANDIYQRTQLQKELILSALKCLRPAKGPDDEQRGCLVYSTCSILVEENEAVIQYALEKCKNLRIVDTGLTFGEKGFRKFQKYRFHPNMDFTRRYYPHVHNIDGFFVAKLRLIGPAFPVQNGVAAPGKSGDVKSVKNSAGGVEFKMSKSIELLGTCDKLDSKKVASVKAKNASTTKLDNEAKDGNMDKVVQKKLSKWVQKKRPNESAEPSNKKARKNPAPSYMRSTYASKQKEIKQ